MASPGNLVKVVAQALGVPESTVTQHDRALLLAGQRSKGGRGPSAAKVTEEDAATLLIPVVAGALIKDSVQTWADYSSLSVENPVPWQTPVGPLQELPPSHTFGAALAALIRGAKEGSLQKFLSRERHPPGRPDWPSYAGLEVQLIASPFPTAHISFEIPEERDDRIYGPISFENKKQFDRAAQELIERFGTGDLTSIKSFTQKTIIAVGEALRT